MFPRPTEKPMVANRKDSRDDQLACTDAVVPVMCPCLPL